MGQGYYTLFVLISFSVMFSCVITPHYTRQSTYSRPSQKKSSQKPVQKKGHNKLTGMASYYGPGFQGKKTANGERFNMHALTAAHKKLPFNTIVKVTNLTNDKSVIVRINDRGPYGKGRIIDLSKAAAKKIEMLQAGITKVRMEIIK